MLAPMLVIVVLLVWALIFAVTERIAKPASALWSTRDSMLFASVAWAGLLVLLTEGLGLLKALERAYLAATWLGLLVLAGASTVWLGHRRGVGAALLARSPTAIYASLRPPRLLFLLLLGFIAFQVLASAIVAWVYVPNNADALAYHLTRVMHWEQNHSLSHFATHFYPETQFGPFAELVILNLQVLTGGDRLANHVQWFAFVFCILGVSNIARKLGANGESQVTAAVLCAALPTAILESSTNQNDLVVALTVVAVVNFGLSLMSEPRGLFWLLGLSCALGLAVLTKATALLFVAPFLGWLFVSVMLRGFLQSLRVGASVGAISMLLNAGYFGRNIEVYGSPLGPPSHFTIEDRTPLAIASVAIRNTALQVAIGEEGSVTKALGDRGLAFLRWLHERTAKDARDPRTTLTPQSDAFASTQSFNEDLAGNPLQLCLLLITLALCLTSRANGRARLLCASLALSFLASSVLKWQIWGTRLVLPLMVVWSAPIAAVTFKLRRDWTLGLVVPAAIAMVSVQWTFANQRRPIDHRFLLFAQKREAQFVGSESYGNYDDYLRFSEQVVRSGCDAVGLQLSPNLISEYPIWRAFREQRFLGRFEHLDADAATAALKQPGFTPCAVVSGTALPGLDGFAMESVPHRPAGTPIFFYVKTPEARAPGGDDASEPRKNRR